MTEEEKKESQALIQKEARKIAQEEIKQLCDSLEYQLSICGQFANSMNLRNALRKWIRDRR